jgi:flagellar biogenesis protein FliO
MARAQGNADSCRRKTWFCGVIAGFFYLIIGAGLAAVAGEPVIHAGDPLSPLPDETFYEGHTARPVAPERDFSAENRRLFSSASNSPAASGATNAANSRAISPPPRGSEPVDARRAENLRHENQRPARPNPAVVSLPVLLIVAAIVAVFALAIYRRYWQGGKTLFHSSPVLEILGRTQIDRNKFLALARVGKRLLVIGVTADGFTPLTEITDEAEATEIMLEARPQTAGGKNMFLEMFRRNINPDVKIEE